MSIIHEKVEYCCECYPFCYKETYIRSEEFGAGITTIYFDTHGVERSFALNDADLKALKLLLSKL